MAPLLQNTFQGSVSLELTSKGLFISAFIKQTRHNQPHSGKRQNQLFPAAKMDLIPTPKPSTARVPDKEQPSPGFLVLLGPSSLCCLGWVLLSSCSHVQPGCRGCCELWGFLWVCSPAQPLCLSPAGGKPWFHQISPGSLHLT